MKWATFCSIGCVTHISRDEDHNEFCGLYLFGVVDNEIDAVQAVATHIGLYKKGHLPWVHMVPAPADSMLFVEKHHYDGNTQQFDDLVGQGFDFDRDLYVAPDEIPASWKVQPQMEINR